MVVDEAHLLTPEQLEQLRLLTSAEMDSATPCAVLLVGQPTLARQLRMGIFSALDQRIAVRYQLVPMDLAESVTYLRHHLALAVHSDAPDSTVTLATDDPVIPANPDLDDHHQAQADR